MRDDEVTGRAGNGLVFAWSRWQLILAILGVILCILMTGRDLKTGADGEDGPFAQIGQDNHQAPLWSLAYAGPGHLASSTTTGEVHLKDLATGRVLWLQDGPGSFALSLASSRDGRTLAVAGNEPSVRLWDTDTGIQQEPLRTGTGAVRSVAISPDGGKLAVGTWKSTTEVPVVMLWGWPGRCRLAEVGGHRGSINAVAFSPDGSRLFMADSAGQMKIWDVGVGAERACRQAHDAGIMAMAISPDDRLFATTSYCDGVVRLWDAADGEPRGSLEVPTGVAGLAFSPDGTTLAMARGDGIASLSDVASGREVGTIRVPTGALQAVAFSEDGRVLATGGVDGSVRLWDVSSALDGGR
jgi:WD40 repeat protein